MPVPVPSRAPAAGTSHGTGDARGDPRWLPRSSRRYEQGTSFPAAGAPPLLLGGVSTGALLAEDNGEKNKHIYPCSPKHHLLSAPFDPRLDEHAQNVVMPNPPLDEAAAVSPAAPSTPAGGSCQRQQPRARAGGDALWPLHFCSLCPISLVSLSISPLSSLASPSSPFSCRDGGVPVPRLTEPTPAAAAKRPTLAVPVHYWRSAGAAAAAPGAGQPLAVPQVRKAQQNVILTLAWSCHSKHKILPCSPAK